MTPASLHPFFAPRSVAVIGASRDPSKVGGSVLANLRSAGFAGTDRPGECSGGHRAGPRCGADSPRRRATGRPRRHRRARPGRARRRSRNVRQRGWPAAVVISAGFRESGRRGEAREARAARVAPDRQPIRVLGPNCLGWIRPSLPAQRHVRSRDAGAGGDRLRLALRRAGRRHPRLGAGSPHGLLALREPRQPGRHHRGRCAATRSPRIPRRG